MLPTYLPKNTTFGDSSYPPPWNRLNLNRELTELREPIEVGDKVFFNGCLNRQWRVIDKKRTDQWKGGLEIQLTPIDGEKDLFNGDFVAACFCFPIHDDNDVIKKDHCPYCGADAVFYRSGSFDCEEGC